MMATDSADANGEGEPPLHVFAYDLNAKQLARLGPKDHATYNPVLKGDTIFCNGYRLDGKGGINVYSLDLSGDHFWVAEDPVGGRGRAMRVHCGGRFRIGVRFDILGVLMRAPGEVGGDHLADRVKKKPPPWWEAACPCCYQIKVGY